MAAARSTLAHVPTTSSAASNCLATQTLCATVMATGETLDLRNYVVVATSNIGSRMLMESRSTDRDNFGASNQPGRPYRRHSNRIMHV